ncbi:MAG: phospholipase D family protein, partial [Myxococcales bacterium]|nr:phospholipase D family protein [Myxococcales bacterium]
SLVVDRDHYDRVVTAMRSATVSLWVATANLKDVFVEAKVGTRARARGRYSSLMDELGEMAARGVEVRVLHAGPPSRALTARLRAGGRSREVELRRCIRVHLKMIAVDGRQLYLGSANFTGAGLGAKAEGRRNFEAGILTSDDVMLDRMQAAFDAIWSGAECKGCKVRSECPRPIDLLSKTSGRRPKGAASGA